MRLQLKDLPAVALGLMALALLPAAPADAQTPGERRGAEPVDLELVLLADATGSIDDREIFFQRQGYADAMTAPDNPPAIPLGPDARNAVTYAEWGQEGTPELRVSVTDGRTVLGGTKG